MHVDRFGYGGPPVVLVHGFGTSSFLWRQVGPMLAVRQCTAFAVDLFGYGESDRPFDADFGLRAQADYLDRAMTALQLTKATVVGMDIGGIVALRVAAERRDRVSRVMLIGPPPLSDLPGAEIRDLQRETARYAFRLSRGLFGASSLLTPFLEASVASARHMPAVLVGRYLAPFLGRDGANHLLALAGSLEEDQVDDLELERVRSPTLVVRGTRDRWCTKGVAEGYVEELPIARYEHVDEVGRLVPEEAPDELVELIGCFVEEESPPGSEAERSVRGVRNFGGRD